MQRTSENGHESLRLNLHFLPMIIILFFINKLSYNLSLLLFKKLISSFTFKLRFPTLELLRFSCSSHKKEEEEKTFTFLLSLRCHRRHLIVHIILFLF